MDKKYLGLFFLVVVGTAFYLIKKEPKNLELYIERGDAKAQESDLIGAIKDYTKAIEIDPENAYSYQLRAEIRSESKDHKSAIEDYTRVIEIDPENCYAYFSRAYEKDKLGNLTYDKILIYLKSSKKENRLEKLKALFRFRNIPFEADLFTWHNEDL